MAKTTIYLDDAFNIVSRDQATMGIVVQNNSKSFVSTLMDEKSIETTLSTKSSLNLHSLAHSLLRLQVPFSMNDGWLRLAKGPGRGWWGPPKGTHTKVVGPGAAILEPISKGEPIEGAPSAVRQELLQMYEPYKKEEQKLQDKNKEILELRTPLLAKQAELILQEKDAVARGDYAESERILQQELSPVYRQLNKLSNQIKLNNQELHNIQAKYTEQARALLQVDNPAEFDVNFGRLRKLKQPISEGVEVFSSLVGTGTLDGGTVQVKRPTHYGKYRAYYDTGAIHMPTGTGPRTTVHELGHWLEDRSPVVNVKALVFLDRRTKGETPKKISAVTGNKSYKDYEVTRPDKFMSAYMGKDYGKGGATEIISMGLEYLAYEPIKFAQQDPEYFDFMYGLMRGR